jgi:hypothetical protein
VEVRQVSDLESDALRERLGILVCERQALRDGMAAPRILEQNRLAIVQAQLELAQALLSEHAEVAA